MGLRLGVNFISTSCDCGDNHRPAGIFLKLLSQREYVYINSTAVALDVVAPYSAEKFSSGDGLTRTLEQVAQQLEFSVGEVDRFSIARNFASGHIDSQIAHFMNQPPGLGRAATQQGFHAGA